MGSLTTHVLDTSTGKPGAGMRIELFRVGDQHRSLLTTTTNADGRCDQPLLADEAFRAGHYELVFNVGDYYRAADVVIPDPAFLDQVVIRFGVAEPGQHYHVPLLVSPFGYSTYRGS